MPDTFTFEEAKSAPSTFSFEEAKKPEAFSFEEAKGGPGPVYNDDGSPKFVSPIQLAPVTDKDIQDTDAQGVTPTAQLGKALNYAGKGLVAGAADVGKTFFRPLTDELYPEQATPGAIEQPTENIDALRAGARRLPAEDLRVLPKPAQLVGRGAQGLIETAPRLAGVTAMTAAGVPPPIAAGAAFGPTEEGFDPEQAAIAALLPFVGKYSGAMVEALASKLGVSKEAALAIFNKLGGASGAAAVLKGVDENNIRKLPPQDRDQARIDSWANIAAMSVLGAIEPRETKAAENETQAAPDATKPTGNEKPAAEPVDLSDLEATLKANQVKKPAAEPAPASRAENPDPLKDNLVEKAIEDLRSGEKHVEPEKAGPTEEPVSISPPSPEPGLPLEEAKTDTAAIERELGKSQRPDVVELESLAPDAFTPGDPVDFSTSGGKLDGKIVSVEKDSVVVEDSEGNRTRVIARNIVPVTHDDVRTAPPATEPDAETHEDLQRQLDEEMAQGAENEKPSGSGSDVPEEQSVHSEPKGDESVAPPVAEVKPQAARVGRGLRAKKIFDRETEMNGPDILDYIVDSGGMLSKTGAKEKWGREKFQQNKSLWDDAPGRLQRPHHNVIYDRNASRAPDQVAQAAYEDGLLSEPSVNELWESIDKASKARSQAYEQQRRHEKILKDEIEQHDRWNKAKNAGGTRIDAADLQPGDKLVLDGTTVKVTDRDPRTGDITVEDGSRFGVQRLESGESIYVEKANEDLLERAAQPEAESGEQKQSDPVLDAIAKARAAVDPLKALKKGELHAMALPEWMARTTADFALQVIEKSYKLGNTIYHAIEDGVNWLREQKIPNFDEREARDYLTAATREAQIAGNGKSRMEQFLGQGESGANPAATPITEPKVTPRTKPVREVPPQPGERDWREIQADMEQADRDVRAALKNPRDKQKQALAAAIFRNRREDLYNHPGYVEHLLRQSEDLNKQIAEAREKRTEHADLRRDLENVTEQLNQVPEKLRNATYARLQDEGVIPKPTQKPIGRSLDKLTDDMREMDIDSPQRTLRERLSISQRVAERIAAAKDGIEKARVKLGAAWKAGLESIKAPPADNGFRNVLKDWIFYDQWTGHQARRWVSMINKKVSDPLRQKAMSIWLDANGDVGRLRFEEAQVPKEYRPIWKAAMDLTPDERALALRIKDDFAEKLEDSKTVGLVEKGRKDYGAPQQWKKPPPTKTEGYATKDGPPGSAGNWKAKLDPRDPFFSFQREYPTYFEGIMAGGVPADLRIGTLVSLYHEAMHKSLSSRAAIWGMKQELASDGKPLVKISGTVKQSSEVEPGTYFVDARARDAGDTSLDGRPYVAINHFALKDWKVAFKTSEDKPIVVKGDMLVHPDIADFLKNELEGSVLRQGKVGAVMKPFFAINRFLKESKLALGTFHMATIGEHAVFHLVNPFKNGFEIDLRNPDQALLVRNGLELGMGGPQAAFEEGVVSGHGGLFSWIPGLGDASRAFSDWLFKDYIPTISMKAGMEALRRNRERYSGKLTDSQIAELTAHQMNAAFGLQNYRLLGRNKVLQDLNSLGFLAPQFLESRVKVVAQALKPYGREQRMMLAMQAATLYVGARLLSAWLDGDPHWEPENAFRVVYNGRSYGLRTIVSDAWEMREFARFMAGRVSPFYKIGHETVFQKDMRTGARKMPPIPTGWRPLDVAQNLLVDFARWMLPAGAEGFLPGAAGREQGPVSTLLSTVGIGSHKYTPETQVGSWARDYNRNSNDPATRTYQRQRDSEAHTEGAYRKLDALLDAGRFEDAAAEYRALLEDGHTPAAIEKRYNRGPGQSFTGNKTREAAFQASLSQSQKEVYRRAIAERQARLDAFRRMLTLPRP